jgi:HIV Tat-specific factor 1
LSPYDQQPRIRIYKEQDSDRCKGDCSICYNAEESVKLAIDIFDGGYLRPNVKINVSKATFDHTTHTEQSNSSSSSGQRKPKLTSAQIKVARNAAKQALVWNEDDDIGVSKSSALRIVVLEGMFTPAELANDDNLTNELEEDIAAECSKLGTIEKVTIFSKNPKGVVVIKFSTSYAAQECIRVMNGRFFGGKKIKSYFWDGVTNYSMVSAADGGGLEKLDQEEKEEESRLDEFGDWLEKDQEELPEEFQLRTE